MTTNASINYIVTISDTRESCDQVFAFEKFGDLKEAQRYYHKCCTEVFGENGGWDDVEHKAVTLWAEYEDGTIISTDYTDKDEYEYVVESFRFFFGA